MVRKVPQSEWRREAVEMCQIKFSDKVVHSSCPTDNKEEMPQIQFQSVKQKQIPVQRVQKKIEISQLQFVLETMRSEIGRMTLEKTFDERDTLNQAVVRIVNETATAWSIECLWHEIQGIIPLASIEQEMEVLAEAERRKHEEILQK